MRRVGVAGARGYVPAVQGWRRSRLRASRASRSLLAGVITALCFLGFAALALWHLKLDALDEARDDIDRLGQTLAVQTTRTLQGIDLVARAEQEAFTQPAAWQEPARAVQARLQTNLLRLPAAAGMAIADRQGHVVYASGSLPAKGADLVEHVRFFAQRDALQFPVYASPSAAEEVFGARAIWLSRRITGRDGQLMGIVAVSVHADYFRDLYRSQAGRRADLITLQRADGSVVLSYDPASDMPFPAPATETTPAVARISSVHALNRFPLFLQTSIAPSTALAGWKTTARLVGGSAAFAAALLGLLAGILAHQSQQHERDRERLREHQDLLQEAQRIAHVGSWSYDSRTGLVQCSEETRRILALEPAAAWRRHEVLSRVHPADRSLLVHAVLTCRRGGRGDVELRVGFRRHYERWVLVRTAVPQDPGAEVVPGALVDITERKAAETSRAQLAAIVESTEDGVMSMSPEGTILAWNRAAQRLFGYAPAEALGRGISSLFPADQASDTHRLLGIVAAGRSVEHYDTVRRSKHGDEVHVSLTVSPILDERERITAASFVARDITAQKKSQMRRNVEHAVMRALLETESTDRAMLRVIRTLCQALGWDYGARWSRDPADQCLVPVETWCSPALEAAGLPAAPQDAGELYPHLVQRVWETGWTILRPDLGHTELPAPPAAAAVGLRSALVFPIKSQNGPVGVLHFLTRELRDTDDELLETTEMIGSQLGQYIERQRAEQERALADARLHRIMANIPDVVFQYKRAPDGSFSFPFISGRVFDLYGEHAADVLRDHLLVFAPVREDQRRELAKSMLRSKRTGMPWSFETLVRCRNGVRRWIRGQASVSYGADGSVYWDGVLTDITPQKRAALEILTLNEKLEQRVAERTHQLEAINQELEAFSYSVSHDLRVPLRAVEGYTRLLQDQYAPQLDQTGLHYLERIGHAAQRMSELVDDLLQLARISRSELKPGPVDLSRMAHEILRALAEDAPQRRVATQVEEKVQVEGDARLLRIVLENLIGNAWKFTQHTSDAVIAFGRQELAGDEVVYVRDNGAGFDMKRAHKLFGAFQRLHRSTDFEGNGIGLATVRRIITLHGGKAWATSAVNEGATFYFTLSGAYRAR